MSAASKKYLSGSQKRKLRKENQDKIQKLPRIDKFCVNSSAGYKKGII